MAPSSGRRCSGVGVSPFPRVGTREGVVAGAVGRKQQAAKGSISLGCGASAVDDTMAEGEVGSGALHAPSPPLLHGRPRMQPPAACAPTRPPFCGGGHRAQPPVLLPPRHTSFLHCFVLLMLSTSVAADDGDSRGVAAVHFFPPPICVPAGGGIGSHDGGALVRALVTSGG